MNTCQNSDEENKKLKERIAYLEKKSSIKEIAILLLHFAAVAVVSIPVKVGIDVCARLFFNKESFLKAKIITYAIIALIAFPLIGCIISRCYGEIQKVKNEQPLIEENTQTKQIKGNWITKWWKNFTSQENLTNNLIYYPVLGIVNTFLFAVQIIAFKGIEEIFKDTIDHSTEIKVGATTAVAVCLVIIDTIFSFALRDMLWKEEKYICTSVKGVTPHTKGVPV